MSQDILQILVCLIGHICKKPKRGNISKCLIIKLPDIAAVQILFHDHLCSSRHILGDKKASCKIIGASSRNISYRNLASCLYQACDHFIQCTIAAAAYYKIHLISILPGHFVCISWALGSMDDHFVTTLVKNIHNVHQSGFDLALSGFGVKYKKKFLLQVQSLFLHIFYIFTL